MNQKKFCGEIVYDKTGNQYWVHSDICHCCGCGDGETVPELTEEEIQFFLANCEEWLRKGKGSGYFWLGDVEALKEAFGDE